MSDSPKKLRALQLFLMPKTGLPAKSLGIVGDTAHDDGYHLGEDRIFAPGGLGNKDYSVRHPRDKSGLSNFASAIDIGGFNRLRELSAFLLAEMKANHPGHPRDHLLAGRHSRLPI